MQAKDFYTTLNNFVPLLKNVGLVKQSKNTYILPQNVKLQFMLDKWGWLQDKGWRFDVRLHDLKKAVPPYGNILPEDSLDLTPHYLLDHNLLDKQSLEQHYSLLPRGVVEENDFSSWYKFYGVDDLHTLLKLVLPIILEQAKTWRV